jgi:putative endonuclease
MAKGGFYIMSDAANAELYHGSSDNLRYRVAQNKGDLPGGSVHCRQNNIQKLVYYELYDATGEALAREKAVKRWRREWKEKLIASLNPTWRDLYEEIALDL